MGQFLHFSSSAVWNNIKKEQIFATVNSMKGMQENEC